MGDRPSGGADTARIIEHDQPFLLPDVSFHDLMDKEYRLSGYNGYVVMLNFWATWCPPCIREMPAFDRLQARYGPMGLFIIPVSQDRGTPQSPPQLTLPEFYNRHDIRYLGIFHSKDATAYSTLRAQGLPTTLIIDRHGRERARIKGAIDWEGPDFTKKLEALLQSGQ
jgi:thiol-disulfide isomerase/thioredoxin